jgi:2-dehydro-3-deoxyphosphogluconate aldolase/(4S)-4-hydroxy-2-oxoglutarate aldolase
MMPRTVAILRGHDPQRAVDLAQRSWALGIDLVEVPVQGEVGWSALQAVAQCAQGRPVGAGTVLTTEDVRRAVDLGCSVIISPGLDEQVVEASLARGVCPLPGVMTATEVGAACRLGLRLCKLFPAEIVGTRWLAAMRGPFPTMRFIAVGGIGVGNAREFLSAGAAGVAFGTSLDDLLRQEDPGGFVASLQDELILRG